MESRHSFVRSIHTAILLFLLACFAHKANGQELISAENNFSCEVNDVRITITPFTNDIIRVTKSPVGHDYEKSSPVIIRNPEDVQFTVVDYENSYIIQTQELLVIINKIDGHVSFLRSEEIVFREKANGVKFDPVMDVDLASFEISQTWILDDDEHIYGLGQFQDGKMSQRNQRLYLLQDILITAIPYFLSEKGYGLFWDNYAPSQFIDDSTGTTLLSSVGDCIDYYFMYGKNADGVISQMRFLTGEVPMFPYWTYGYWQCRERYKNQEEVIDVIEKYRELKIPLDGIIQDWQYWGDNYHWNAMEFDSIHFPDAQELVDNVHELNAHIIFSIWSAFGPETRPYAALDSFNLLFDIKTWPLSGKAGWPPDMNYPSGAKIYDAYNPKARKIYWKYLKDGLFDLGVDGWWMDSTEPDHHERKDSDYDQATYLGSFRKYRNLYPLMTVGGVYNNQRATNEDKRVFILTRSAFAGQQRYGANAWSGDVVADWPTFKNQIAAGLNYSICGLPYWNSDIGGFYLWEYPNKLDDPNYVELYVRWLQFGAFCPMMRSHGTDAPREIYQFGQPGHWAFDAIQKFIDLRYRLLPYNYSTSWQVTNNAYTMMRPLVMDFAHDKAALNINDQYMFGQSLMVCPVADAMYTMKDTLNRPANFDTIGVRQIYLPKGIDWIDFWTGEKYKGGQLISKPCPIDIIPIYVPAGSIIPFGPEVQYADQKYDPIEIRIYPGADGHFTLYDDEKDNYNYENGAYSTIGFEWDDSKRTLIIHDRKGSYPNMPQSRLFEISKFAHQGNSNSTNKYQKKTIKYDGNRIKIRIK